MQDGAKCFSPILSHTLIIVVVQWPKFDHSTTLNDKGYKAHKEMGKAHKGMNSHENIKLTHPHSHELCKKVLSITTPILSHTLSVVLGSEYGPLATSSINGVTKHAQRWGLIWFASPARPGAKIILTHILSHELY